jgi:hypothetical protein
MLVEAGLLLATGVVIAELKTLNDVVPWIGLPLTVVVMWHIVAIPICCFYLCGNPIVMTLVPLIDSAESRAYRAELRQRPALDDHAFYELFDKDSGVPCEVVAGVRRALCLFDDRFERSIPSDFLYHLEDEMDFGDLLYEVENEFRIRFTKPDCEKLDGTLENLVRLVDKAVNSERH